jgi:hypothetical protein
MDFLFQLSLSLGDHFFRLPPSTCVYAKLARVSMKEGLIFSLKGISRVGGVVFWIVEVLATLENMGNRPILEHVPLEHNVIGLRVTPNV